MNIDTDELLRAADEMLEEYKELIPFDNSFPEKTLRIFKQVIQKAKENQLEYFKTTGTR